MLVLVERQRKYWRVKICISSVMPADKSIIQHRFSTNLPWMLNNLGDDPLSHHGAAAAEHS